MSNLNHSRNLAVRRRARCFHVPFLLPVLIAGLGLMLAGQVTAQTFTTLKTFTAATTNSLGVYTNSDGISPNGLISSTNTLYGTAQYGGSSGNGTVFRVNTNGTGFAVLHSFTAGVGTWPSITNSDGAVPGGLVLSGNILYGTANQGGGSGDGTVFKLNIDGSGFMVLHSFSGGTNSTGPLGGLVLSGNTLYGIGGESSGLFAVNTDGTGFTNLHSFNGGSNGFVPEAGVILSGDTLYGTTTDGGSWDNGIVFKVNTDGNGFTVLHSFSGPTWDFGSGSQTNSDGISPAGLVLSKDTLYGTTMLGDISAGGNVFKVNTDGTGFTTLHRFGTDGEWLAGGLILSGNTLYGEASFFDNGGTLFSVKTDGTGFATLLGFKPEVFIISDNTLYGAIFQGGSSGNGTIFSISLPPQLAITSSGQNVILSWPTNFTGFYLQDTVTLAAGGWISTTLPQPPIIANAQFVVTIPKPASGQHFYRLSQ